jgi:chromosome segregation ATPase
MDWVAEVSPGTFYGPIHRQALAELSRDGSLPAEAPRFRRQTGDAAPEVTASRERELEARLAEQQHAFAERAAALERDLRAARADAEQARGSTGARDLEREAERQEHQAALARQQAEIVKREARATALEREVERLAALDRERLAAQARLSDLERQVADAEARVVQARQSADAAVAAARQGEKAAEQRLADFREQTVAQRQEHAAMLEKVRLLRQRQESARKLLQQALASMGRAAEAPEPETIDAEPVATPAAAPGPAAASSTDVPPRAGVSLAEIEAQAQRELRHLGSKAAPFLARK